MHNRRPVVLVIPPSVFFADERVFCHLGILKVAAVLERDGFVVDVLDLSGIENYVEAVQEYLEVEKPTAIGFTTTTPQLPAVSTIIKAIRSAYPDLRIILGGPHCTLINAAVKYERKIAETGRAHAAMRKLEQLVDVIVAGD